MRRAVRPTTSNGINKSRGARASLLASLASRAARARRTVTEQTGKLTLAADSAKGVARNERWFNY